MHRQTALNTREVSRVTVIKTSISSSIIEGVTAIKPKECSPRSLEGRWHGHTNIITRGISLNKRYVSRPSTHRYVALASRCHGHQKHRYVALNMREVSRPSKQHYLPLQRVTAITTMTTTLTCVSRVLMSMPGNPSTSTASGDSGLMAPLKTSRITSDSSPSVFFALACQSLHRSK